MSTDLTAAQNLVEALVHKNVDWEHIDQVLALMPQVLNPGLGWGSYKQPFLSMIAGAMHSNARTSRDLPPEYVLERVLAADPQALTRRDSRGRSATAAVFRAFEEHASTQTLGWWLTHAPMEELLAYRKGWSGSEGGSGADLYSVVIVLDKDRDDEQPTVLPLLFVRGLDPQLSLKSGYPLAASFNTTAQWNAYLEAGGNPDLTVRAGGEAPVPLWKHLIHHASGTHRAELEAWAAANRNDALAAKHLADYWAKLKKSAHGYVNSSEVGGLLMGHPQAPNLTTDEGANPAMFGITMNASAWRTLEQKRYAALLPARDNNGRSLWNYALGYPDKLDNDVFRFLSRHKVSAAPSQVTGRGLLADMVLSRPRDTGAIADLISVPKREALKGLMSTTTAAQWFAIRAEEEPALVSGLLANTSSGMDDFLMALLKAFPQAELSASLKGAFAVILCPAELEQARALMAEGGIIAPADADRVREAMTKRNLPTRATELLALSEANALAANTAPAAGGARTSGPRL